MILKSIIFLLASVGFHLFAAPAPLSVELIDARGTGCPQGSYSYAMTGDGSVLSVLFSQFTAQANSETDPRQRSECNLILRLRMAPGYGVGIMNTDYRGFAYLNGPKARANFRSSWVLRDDGQKIAKGPVLEQSFMSPFNDQFFVRQANPEIQWIGCRDRQARLILQSSLNAVARKGSETMITLDSSDISSEMQFFLSVRPCDKMASMP